MPDDAAPLKTDSALVGDGLTNLVSGQGVPGRDKLTAGHWSLMARLITPVEIVAAYRTSWLVRRVHDVIPSDMVKNWRTWKLQGGEADAITDEEKRLQVRKVCREALRLARLRGGAAVVMGLPGNPAQPAPEKITKGQLKYLWVTTRDYLTFSQINRDLTSPLFGGPDSFQLSAPGNVPLAKIHPSRVLIFKGLPGANMPSGGTNELDEFWGYPLMETLNECIQNATMAMDGVAAMIPEALVDIISIPGLTEKVSTSAGEARVAKRLAVAKLFRSQFQAAIMDGGDGAEGSGEEWETRQLTFAHLPELMNAFLQFVAGAAGMTFTKLVGAPPEGMNATGEHDERNYDADLTTRQAEELTPNLDRLDPFLVQSAGVTDAKATMTMNPVRELTRQEQAELDNLNADTLNILQTTGLIQHDALATTAVASFNQSPNFPGLAENVAASTEPLPAIQEAENATLQAQTKAAAPVVMGANPAKPGGGAMRATRRAANASAKSAKDSQVITDGREVRSQMMSDGSTLTLRTVTLAQIRDATPRSLYISRKLMNPQEFLNHWRAQNVEGLMAAGDLHVTVVHSDATVDWMKLPADWSSDRSGRLQIPPGGPRVVTHLGNYDVLEFASSDLQWRHSALVDAGVEVKWPDYKPHVSFRREELTDFGMGGDVEGLKPYAGRLLFGPEIWEEVI